MKYLLFLIPFLIHAQSDLLLLMDDGASFLPSDIPNLTVWIDPAAEYCVGTPPEYDYITDRSGNSNDATFYQQASWYADSLNGHPAIYFDGVDDYLQISDSLGYKFTAFIVVKAYQNTGNGRVIGNFTDTRGIYTAATTYQQYYDGNLNFGAWNVWAILTWAGIGADCYGYYNNGSYDTGTMTGFAPSGLTILGLDATPQKCIIAEYIKYGRNLTEAEITQVNTYLGNKFNITIQ